MLGYTGGLELRIPDATGRTPKKTEDFGRAARIFFHFWPDDDGFTTATAAGHFRPDVTETTDFGRAETGETGRRDFTPDGAHSTVPSSAPVTHVIFSGIADFMTFPIGTFQHRTLPAGRRQNRGLRSDWGGVDAGHWHIFRRSRGRWTFFGEHRRRRHRTSPLANRVSSGASYGASLISASSSSSSSARHSSSSPRLHSSRRWSIYYIA